MDSSHLSHESAPCTRRGGITEANTRRGGEERRGLGSNGARCGCGLGQIGGLPLRMLTVAVNVVLGRTNKHNNQLQDSTPSQAEPARQRGIAED